MCEHELMESTDCQPLPGGGKWISEAVGLQHCPTLSFLLRGGQQPPAASCSSLQPFSLPWVCRVIWIILEILLFFFKKWNFYLLLKSPVMFVCKIVTFLLLLRNTIFSSCLALDKLWKEASSCTLINHHVVSPLDPVCQREGCMQSSLETCWPLEESLMTPVELALVASVGPTSQQGEGLGFQTPASRGPHLGLALP